jgi:hypothetical protein
MKRILALDGGGIRGVFSLSILARIEELFRLERGRPGLVLRDEFDLFAGTSTGAIIATCLAWGLGVAEIQRFYLERGAEMFAPAGVLERWWRGKYRATTVARLFQERFCEDDEGVTPALLGTPKLGQGAGLKVLLVIMRNATTGSPWPVSNHPGGRFNNPALPDCNLRIPLWKLLRASTAAPLYFPPEEIELAGETRLYVDGGITPYNNPALIAFLHATLPGYGVGWATGTDRLQVVSVGTGQVRTRLAKREARRVNVLDQAAFIVPALLGAVGVEQDLLCRVLGRCLHGGPIDAEIGDLLAAGPLSEAEKKFSYVRYNREFTAGELADLRRETGMHFSLDNLGLIPFLKAAGESYAAAHVKREHLFPDA